MLEAVLLDSLLGIAILLLIPLGSFRGGLREVCSSAGLLLGILLSQQWAVRWGNTIGDLLNVDDNAAQFTTAVVTVIVTTMVVGYGASSSFNYHPGPGGKMFGAAIAVINGVVLSGFLINAVADHMNDGEYPQVVSDGQISRALSSGFDWVLLGAAITVALLSVLGMVVRERESADQPWASANARTDVRQVLPTKPYMTPESEKIEVPPPAADPNSPEFVPVKIREVRHWEEQQPEKRTDTITGWQQTWPKSATGERIRPPWESAEEPARPVDAFKKVPPANIPVTDPTETLKQWIASDDDPTEAKPRRS
jgi:hypothetical protein